MVVRDPYSVHPALSKYAAGWDRYAATCGNEDAELWREYCTYLADFDGREGKPLGFDAWLAEQQQYAADWDESTGQICIAHDALRQEFADPDEAVQIAYAEYCAVTENALTFDAWLVALAQAAGQFDRTYVNLDSRQVCGARRPHLRYIQ